MKIKRIQHLGFVSKEITQCQNFFQNILKLQHISEETVEEQKVNVTMFAVENSNIEILEPITPDSPIQKFLQTRGSGIHHVAFEVDDIDIWLNYLKAENIKLIDQTPRLGAHDTKIVFIHPQSTGGILVELVQRKTV